MRSHPRGRSRLLALLAAFLATSVVAGVLSAGLVLPRSGRPGRPPATVSTMFDTLPGELERQPLAEGSTMYASDGKTVIATFYEENRVDGR